MGSRTPHPGRNASATCARTSTPTAGCRASSPCPHRRRRSTRRRWASPATRSSATLRASRSIAELDGSSRPGVSWADAFMRLVNEGNDALDPTLQRTGYRGERNQVVLHHDVAPRRHPRHRASSTSARSSPTPSPGSSPATPRSASPPTRPACSSGSPPPCATPSRALRRAMERRDQGCVHPLCNRRRWLHIHHLQLLGRRRPHRCRANLVCLCTQHHRELHEGLFTHRGQPRSRHRSGSSTPVGDRSNHPTSARPGPSASSSPPPSPSPTAAASPPVPSTGTDLARPRGWGRDGAVAGTPTESRAAGRHSQRCLSP